MSPRRVIVLWQGTADLRGHFLDEDQGTCDISVGHGVSPSETIRLLSRVCDGDQPRRWIDIEVLEKDATGGDAWRPVERLASPDSLFFEKSLAAEDEAQEGDDVVDGVAVLTSRVHPLNGEWVACLVAALLGLSAQASGAKVAGGAS